MEYGQFINVERFLLLSLRHEFLLKLYLVNIVHNKIANPKSASVQKM